MEPQAKIGDLLHVAEYDLIMNMFYTENSRITKATISKVRDLYRSMTPPDENNPVIHVRHYMLGKCLEGYLDHSLIPSDGCNLGLDAFVLDGGKYQVEVADVLNSLEPLNDSLLTLANKKVSDVLKFGFLEDHFGTLRSIVDMYDTQTYTDLTSFIDQTTNTIETLNRLLKSVQYKDKAKERDFSTMEGDLRDAITQTIHNLQSDRGVTLTGIRKLNSMIDGGFKPGKVYVFMAVSGDWKSGMLYNIPQWAVIYNRGAQCFDPTKKPAYIYISLENSIDETIGRKYSYYVGPGTPLKDSDPEVLIDAMKHEEAVSQGSDAKIYYKYRPSNTVTTEFVRDCILEAADEGYEIKGVSLDYLRRIRPANNHQDFRIRLGNAIDELHVIAEEHKCWITTGNQINDAGIKIIEDARQDPTDVVALRQINARVTAESKMIFENSDGVFVGLRKTVNEKLHLQLVRLKLREKDPNAPDSDLKLITHPFVTGNEMRLVEDMGLDSSVSLEANDGLESASTIRNAMVTKSGGFSQGTNEGNSMYRVKRPF